MKIKIQNNENFKWSEVAEASSFRFTTKYGTFTISDHHGEVTIQTEHQLQIAPMFSNCIAINERIQTDGSKFDRH